MQFPKLSMPDKKYSSRRGFLSALVLLILAGLGGAVYWHVSGREDFDGVLQSNTRLILAESTGVVASVEVAEGQQTPRGKVLLRFASEPLRQTLLEERQKLAMLELMLPPEYVHANTPGGAGHDSESMTQRLERQRQIEENATKQFQEATDREAQASIAYNRISRLVAQGGMPREQLAAAEAALEVAQEETRQARKVFESLSLDRAATGADIQRLKEAQVKAGADRIPVNQRLRNYQEQLQRVAEAEAGLNAAFMAAPEDGIISSVSVQPGQNLVPGQPCFTLIPVNAVPMVRANVSEAVAGGLKVGQRCLVRFPGLLENDLEGRIALLTPAVPAGDAQAGGPQGQAGGRAESRADAGGLTAVYISISPQSAPTPLLASFGGGTKAKITVLLRSPLQVPWVGQEATPAMAAQSQPVQGQSGASSAQRPGVQQAGVLKEQVQPPAPDPVHVRAGSPESMGMPPARIPAAQSPAMPELPPMQAPKNLRGSPLPDPANNPSLATPGVLERVDNPGTVGR